MLRILIGLAFAAPADAAELGLAPPRTVSVGHSNTCALNIDGTLACWGRNKRKDPVIDGAPAGTFTHVSVGDYTACAIGSDSTLSCWGKADNAIVTDVPAGKFARVDVGAMVACALEADGTPTCWGKDPREVAAPPAKFVQVSAGFFEMCGLQPNGSVRCWGKSAPSDQAGPYVRIAVSAVQACAVNNAGAVHCWTRKESKPTKSFDGPVSAIADRNCGIRRDGRLVCWSGNPEVASGSFNELELGFQHGCGRRKNGSIACWGNRLYELQPIPEALTQATRAEPPIIVIAGGATDAAGGRAALERWKMRAPALGSGLKLADGYPKVMESKDVKGLNPGFHIVVLGVCPEGMAGTFADLKALDPGIYTKPVTWKEPYPCAELPGDLKVEVLAKIKQGKRLLSATKMSGKRIDEVAVDLRHKGKLLASVDVYEAADQVLTGPVTYCVVTSANAAGGKLKLEIGCADHSCTEPGGQDVMAEFWIEGDTIKQRLKAGKFFPSQCD